jgi:hypothetical protein
VFSQEGQRAGEPGVGQRDVRRGDVPGSDPIG